MNCMCSKIRSVMLYKWIVIAITLAVCPATCLAEVGCRDAQGSPVDWFIVYKLPQVKDSVNPLIRDGVAHMYMDVNKQSFVLSDVSLNDSQQAIAHTLQPIYDNVKSQHVVYTMYNDEFPDGRKSFTHGHTKGVVFFDESSGFWLVHSTPKFPDFANGRYFWPRNAEDFGQSMLCISMKTSEFVKVSRQLMYNYPAVYDWNIPPSFRAQFADLVHVCDGGHVKEAPWNSTVQLTSLAGQQFTSFAKFTNFEEDLYWYLVAPTLGDDLYVETWMNVASKLKLPSFCNGSYHVENVQAISLKGGLTFNTTHDHSKWAITEQKRWLCIGDINRTKSQYSRGGGTVCSLLPAPWEAFNGAVKAADKCGT